MQEVSLSKQIGGVSIIAGTAVGAGMLGIPFAVAAVGFSYAVVLLFVVWAIMYATAMLLVEVNISQPLDIDMDSMAYNLLGKWGKLLNLTFYLLLLYALLTAYIFLGGALFREYLFAPIGLDITGFSRVFFCVIFGYCIFMGTKTTFYVNKFFLFLKIVAFLLFVSFVLFSVEAKLLMESNFGIGYAWFAIPILVTSFGFHIVIPSIRNYFRNDRVFKRVIKIGATTPLVVYLIWVLVTLGTIPLMGNDSFVDLIGNNATLASAYVSQGKSSEQLFIKFFENFAIITSFLGVALALFSFNRDLYSIDTKVAYKKVAVLLITLVPPLLFSILFINSFIAALGYASIFVALLLIIQPVLLVWVLRNSKGTNTLLSKVYLSLILLSGVVIIVLQLLVSFDKLPHI